MSPLVSILGDIVLALAICGCVYSVIAAILVRRFMAARPAAPTAFPAVTLVKPLHGAPAGLRRSLEGFCDQDYPGAVQILFGVQDAGDPALEVVRALIAERPELDIAVVVNGLMHGKNRKVSNLINMGGRVKHEVLVLSDADIAVTPGWLRTVVGALAPAEVGAVSCLYVGAPGASVWSRLAAMSINYQFLPSAVLGRAAGLAEPCFGSTLAIGAKVLEEIGGFEVLADHLADDYEIGRAVREKGYRIAIPPMVVTHLCGETSARELIDHELRWGLTVRRIDLPGYAGSVITHPFALALAGAVLVGFTPFSVALACVILAGRLALRAAVDGATGTSAGDWWLIPARDMLSFGVFVASFMVNTVGWHGRRFRVDRDGVLSHP